MDFGDIEVIDQHRHVGHDVVQKGLPSGVLLALRQLDPDAEFGDGDGGDGDVVVVGNDVIQVAAGTFRVDQEGRVKEEPPQDRSSTSTSSRSAASSVAQSGSR